MELSILLKGPKFRIYKQTMPGQSKSCTQLMDMLTPGIKQTLCLCLFRLLYDRVKGLRLKASLCTNETKGFFVPAPERLKCQMESMFSVLIFSNFGQIDLCPDVEDIGASSGHRPLPCNPQARTPGLPRQSWRCTFYSSSSPNIMTTQRCLLRPWVRPHTPEPGRGRKCSIFCTWKELPTVSDR